MPDIYAFGSEFEGVMQAGIMHFRPLLSSGNLSCAQSIDIDIEIVELGEKSFLSGRENCRVVDSDELNIMAQNHRLCQACIESSNKLKNYFLGNNGKVTIMDCYQQCTLQQ